jgi:predicted amidophosphoribosyltransferase
MNCPNCGKEVNENQKFCSHCGTKLKDNENIEIHNNFDETKENEQQNQDSP